MNSFHFKPNKDEEDAYRIRVNETQLWWVQFNTVVDHVFCTNRQSTLVLQADEGISWAGLSTSGRPRILPTDDPNLVCVKFDAPHYLMIVDEMFMKEWMEIVRANGLHGKYRKAGTREEYEF